MYEFPPSAPAATLQPSDFILSVRVYYEDTDAGGVVYYASYLRFCERARSECLRALGFEQRRLLENGGPVFVVRSVHADYISPAKLDDTLTITSKIINLRHASVCFLQQISRGNSLLFTAETKIACISPSKGRPVPWPDALRNRFHACLCLSPGPDPQSQSH
ncbi:MAG: tol-pal system-associated acyl-CoA thioesterase [Azoarcus sp.]|jgi:acyl-CoA thioester hydrolase|nr:tol-pal system-associated acyl-CoA thioesterase [Azoarcus sp.]